MEDHDPKLSNDYENSSPHLDIPGSAASDAETPSLSPEDVALTGTGYRSFDPSIEGSKANLNPPSRRHAVYSWRRSSVSL